MRVEDLRAVLSSNIKKYRSRRGWSQCYLAEKIDLSANFISDLETGKGWVSPQTLVCLANALEIEVFQLFTPNSSENSQDTADIAAVAATTAAAENEYTARFAKDMALALDVSASHAASLFRQTVEKVCREYGVSAKN